ncbi:MAG: glycosyltransferase family 87 protein [Phycisphaerales bacterium]|nr:glycosyltransferase family 87 protein [Phycisphaerales bacterium]
MLQFFSKIYTKKGLLALYVLMSIIATVQMISLPPKSFEAGQPAVYTEYNNYIIFKQSAKHLLHNQDLYQLYLQEQFDLFKYSPTFSLFFVSLAYLPNALGLGIWLLLNTLVFFWGVVALPKLNGRQKNFILLFSLIELFGSIQNAQSNALIAGLLLLSFSFLENRKYFLAVLFMMLTVYIKVFGILLIMVFIFYPDKWKLILYTLFWLLVLFFLPILFISFSQLAFLYHSWVNLLSNDHALSDGLSVIGVLSRWFALQINKDLVLGIGILLVGISYLQFNKYKHYSFRLLSLASVLIFMVIFNHRAESPSFIIAIAGIALWYVLQKEPSHFLNVCMVITLILTSLSPSDIFPLYIRNEFFNRFLIKVIPAIIIWMVILKDLLYSKKIQEL